MYNLSVEYKKNYSIEYNIQFKNTYLIHNHTYLLFSTPYMDYMFHPHCHRFLNQHNKNYNPPDSSHRIYQHHILSRQYHGYDINIMMAYNVRQQFGNVSVLLTSH